MTKVLICLALCLTLAFSLVNAEPPYFPHDQTEQAQFDQWLKEYFQNGGEHLISSGPLYMAWRRGESPEEAAKRLKVSRPSVSPTP